MKIRIPRLLTGLCLVAAALSLPAPIPAATADPGLWHEHSLQIRFGALDSPVQIDSRNTYAAADLDADAELALGYSMISKSDFELVMELSMLRASGTQYNAPGSGNEANRLDIDTELTLLWFTARRRFEPWMDLFVPWIGGGLNVGRVEQEDQEWLATNAGLLARPRDTSSSTVFGVQGCAGVDIYFARTSALALTIEGRYNIELASGSFEGDLDCAAFRVGLRWDIWPATD